jgi:hypothetical protein
MFTNPAPEPSSDPSSDPSSIPSPYDTAVLPPTQGYHPFFNRPPPHFVPTNIHTIGQTNKRTLEQLYTTINAPHNSLSHNPISFPSTERSTNSSFSAEECQNRLISHTPSWDIPVPVYQQVDAMSSLLNTIRAERAKMKEELCAVDTVLQARVLTFNAFMSKVN